MDHRAYRIKKALIIPLGVVLFLLVFLFIFTIGTTGERLETGLFAALTLPAAYLFLESLYRAVAISEEAITVVKLFGRKKITWNSITHVGGLTIKNKAWILLTTTHGLYIISNVYDRFSSIAHDIAARMESDRPDMPDIIEEPFRQLMREPPSGNASVGMAWSAAGVLVGIALLKIYSIF